MSELLENGIACIQDALTAIAESGDTIDRHSKSRLDAIPANTKEVSAEFSSQVHVGAVRSGQQIYSQKKSLVVIGNVNSGAEIMADGDIFVFGRLMGRAVAGIGESNISSPSRCSIYTTHFAASLVGIQSIFIAPDEHKKSRDFIGKSVRISLCDPLDGSSEAVVVESPNGKIGMRFTPA